MMVFRTLVFSIVIGASWLASAARVAAACPSLIVTEGQLLALATTEQRVQDCNRDVLAARRAISAAEADRVTAGQRPNPNLTLGASNINPNAGVGSGSLRDKTVDQSIRLDQLIERGDKGALRERQSDALLAAVRADYSDVLRLQRLATRTAYFELAYQQARAQVASDFVTLTRNSLGAAEKRLALGDIAANEANRFRLDAAKSENEMRSAQVDLKRARAELARLIGVPSVVSTLVVGRWMAPEIGLRGPMNTSLVSRADVVAATRRVDAAEIARDLARAITTRDLTVGAQFDRWPTSAGNAQGTGNSFGISFSVPLFVRHANEGEAKRAAVDVDVARDLVSRLSAQASMEVALAEEAWTVAQERLSKVDHELLPLAREVAKAAEFAYSKGATSVLDLLDARRNLKQAELDAALAQADTAKAWAQFQAATEVHNGNQQ